MKTRFIALILAVALTVIVLLSACSGDGNNTLPPISEAPSSNTPIAPTVSIAEVSEVDSSSKDEDTEDGSEETEEPQFVRITADSGLRMRTGAGSDFDIIKTIPYNAYAEIAESEENNPDWLYVSYGSDIGWVSAEYVVREERQPASAQAPNWAQAYFDYLSNSFDIINHSDYCDFPEENWWEFKEKGSDISNYSIYTFRIQFRSFSGYDYPVMVRRDGLPHSGGVGDNVELIENGKVASPIHFDDVNAEQFFKVDPDPNGPSSITIKGEQIANFDDSNDLRTVFTWLKSQGAVGDIPAPKQAAASNQSTNWAQVYYNYLNGLEPIRYNDCFPDTGDNSENGGLRESGYIDRGNDFIYIYSISFTRYPSYDYPVMSRMFLTSGHKPSYDWKIIKDGKVISVEDTLEFLLATGDETIKAFGGDINASADDLLGVLAWLKTQM